jgi:hypothetical protein
VNRPTTLTDSDQGAYSAAFTCDANGSITQIVETVNAGHGNIGQLYSYFDVDDLGRVVAQRVKARNGSGQWIWTKRVHAYSGTGAILRSTYKTWQDGNPEPGGNALLHSWGQDGKHVQNIASGPALP